MYSFRAFPRVVAAASETKFDGQFSFKLPKKDQDELILNAERMGSTKDIVLRELVRSFNAFCENGRRPVFPFSLAAHGYRVEAGRLIDATPSEIIDWMDDEDALLEMAPHALKVRHAKSEHEKLVAAATLAEMVDAAMKRPRHANKAAEAQGRYTVDAPPAKQNPAVEPTRKRNPKTA